MPSRRQSTNSRCSSGTIPIVFSVGEKPVPLALMGLNEGVNVFLDADGKLLDNMIYIPAYMRRYPFLLARLRPDTDELSLCFDPTSGAVGEFEEGEPLFDGDQPSEATKAILQFCEQFETAGQRTAAFVEELKKSGLLMDGEVAIQPEGADQPFVYRGFQMVDEEKLRELARRRAAQDEPERDAGADLRPSVLADANPRGVRAPGGAGQGPGRRAAAARPPPTPKPGPRGLIRRRSPSRRPSNSSPRPTARASISAATRSNPGPGASSAWSR